MGGHGKPASSASDLDGRSLRVVVIGASWHEQVMAGLWAGARRALADAGVTDVVEVNVPGTFELPVAAAHAAHLGPRPDAIVALGVVIRGGTPHFEYVCQAATSGLTDVAVNSGIPVGFGVLTCDNDAQALDRAGLPGAQEDKGYDATLAAIQTALTLRDLKPPAAVA